MSVARKFKPQERALLLGGLFHLGLEQVAALLGKDVATLEEYLDHLNEDRSELQACVYNHFSAKNTREMSKPPEKRRKRSSRRNVSGYRDDLKMLMRSKIESNTARCFNLLFGRDAWQYEETRIVFDPVPKVGPKRYVPDFIIDCSKVDSDKLDSAPLPNLEHLLTHSSFVIEVKGRFMRGDVSKLRTYTKQFPEQPLVLLTYRKSKKVIEWCRKKNITVWFIDDLKEQFQQHIAHWE